MDARTHPPQANRAQAFERKEDWAKALADYEGEKCF